MTYLVYHAFDVYSKTSNSTEGHMSLLSTAVCEGSDWMVYEEACRKVHLTGWKPSDNYVTQAHKIFSQL